MVCPTGKIGQIRRCPTGGEWSLERRRGMPQPNQSKCRKMVRLRRAFVTMDVAIAIAAAIFLVDLLSDLQGAVAVLYIAIPLILASAYSERVILAAAGACGALATIAFLSQHLSSGDNGAD